MSSLEGAAGQLRNSAMNSDDVSSPARSDALHRSRVRSDTESAVSSPVQSAALEAEFHSWANRAWEHR
jgi:hypothetical protein